MKSRNKRILYGIAAVLLLGVLGFSLFQLLSMNRDYAAEKAVRRQLLAYAPEEGEGAVETDPEGRPLPVKPGTLLNRKIALLQERYPNAIGWITVPGTDVSYPFTQAEDNDYYLRRDLEGNYLYAGVPFLDYRCAPDFSDGNTVIYGHNLRNGTMFGTLESFKSREFFEAHRYFTVFLRDRTIRAEIIACVVFQAETAPFLYQLNPGADYPTQLSTIARCCLDLSGLPGDARFITLSTCDYELSEGRTVIVGRILE